MPEPDEITRVRELVRRRHLVGHEDVAVLLEYYDNAKTRLRLARAALLDDGYFTPEQVSGDEIAPRIRERLAAARQEIDGLVDLLRNDGELDEPEAAGSERWRWDPDCTPCDQPGGRLHASHFVFTIDGTARVECSRCGMPTLGTNHGRSPR